MSGHSKWHSIKHKKAAIDAKRGASGFEAFVAGGRTPTGRDAIEWAKEAETRLVMRVSAQRSDPGVEPSKRGAATPDWF